MRHSLLVGVSIVVGCLILGLFLSPATVGQGPAVPASKVGKYQVALGADGLGKNAMFLCDTETGQLWQCYPQRVVVVPKATWAEMPSPIKPQK